MSYRDANSPYYYCEYTDATGKRVRTSSRSKFKAVADKMENELKVRAERVRKGLEVHDRNPDKMTVAKGLQWWLDNIAKGQAQHKDAGHVIKKHLIESALADIPLEQLTHGKITSFLRGKVSKDFSASSANHLRAYLSGMFTRLAAEDLFVGENPVRRTKPLPVSDVEPRTNPAHYVPVLLDQAPTLGWKVAIAVAANTGMRAGEIQRVFGEAGWPDVDLDARIIWVKKTKRKNVRRVAITKDLAALLADAKERHVEMPGNAAWNKAPVIVRNALERAKIVDADATFHGLRGTWATQLMSSPGISRDVVKYMGWGPDRSSVMSVHYIDYPDEVLRREIDRLSWPTPPTPAVVLHLKKEGAA